MAHPHSSPSTPLTPYNTTSDVPTDNLSPPSSLPNFFSADDLIQASQDPRFPPVSVPVETYYHPNIRGAPNSNRTTNKALGNFQAPPYAQPLPPDPSSEVSSFSLPLYSHTESPPVRHYTAATTRKDTSNLRSLVGRSFQIPLSSEKPQLPLHSPTPQTPPTRTQAPPTRTQAPPTFASTTTSSLPPHLVQSTTVRPGGGGGRGGGGGGEAEVGEREASAKRERDQEEEKEEEEEVGVDIKTPNLFHHSPEDGSPLPSDKAQIVQPSSLPITRAPVVTMATPQQPSPLQSSGGSEGLSRNSSRASLPGTPSGGIVETGTPSGGQSDADTSSVGLSDTRTPIRGGSDTGTPSGSYFEPRTPSGGRSDAGTPLSPKDVRERLMGETTPRPSGRSKLASLLTFGLLGGGEPSETTTKEEEEQKRREEREEEKTPRREGDGVSEEDSEYDGGERDGEAGNKSSSSFKHNSLSEENHKASSSEEETKTREEEKEKDEVESEEEATDFHLLGDVETSSVMSLEQLTETLHADPHWVLRGDREKTPTPLTSAPHSQTLSLPPSPTPLHSQPHSHTHTHSPSQDAVPPHLKMPAHIRPPSSPAKLTLPFPPGFLSEPTPTPPPIPSPSPSMHYQTPSHSYPYSQPTRHTYRETHTPSDWVRSHALESQLSDALQAKANLEGQLESVLEECQAMLCQRAELQTKLARTEAKLKEMEEEREAGRGGGGGGGGGDMMVGEREVVEKEMVKLREELKAAQKRHERERKAMVGSRSSAPETQRLQEQLKEVAKKMVSQDHQLRGMKEEVEGAIMKLEEEKDSRGQAEHQLSSLKASYQTLEEAKDWMHQQLQDALQSKGTLQEDVRRAKAAAIASSIRQEQLQRENAVFQEQIASLQSGVLQDKAQLVSELEAIEANVLSREDSYAKLLLERTQLEELVAARGRELEKASEAVAASRVERDELLGKEKEWRERERELEKQCRVLQKGKEVIKGEQKQTGEELSAREEELAKLEKTKAVLLERLREAEVGIVNRDGTIQGLRDAQNIIQREVMMSEDVQEKMERELEEAQREVGRLEGQVKVAEEEGREKEEEVQSMAEAREVLEVEKQELRERLREKEEEVEEKARELSDVEAQSKEIVSQFQAMTSQFHSITADRSAMDDKLVEKDQLVSAAQQEREVAEEEKEALKRDNHLLQNRLAQLQQQKTRLEGQLEAGASSLPSPEELQRAVRERAAVQVQLDTQRASHDQELRAARGKLEMTEEDLQAAKREVARANKQAEKATLAKEEALGKLAQTKSQAKANVAELKQALEQARCDTHTAERDLAALKEEVEEQTEECRRMRKSSEALEGQLRQEAVERAEVERASGLVAVRLKENAEEKEKELREMNSQLMLEVERLKGRLAGLSSTQQAIRSHSGELESALAQRETSLTKMVTDTQRALREKQTENHQLRGKMAALEEETNVLRGDLLEVREQLQEEQTRGDSLSEEISQTNVELVKLRVERASAGPGQTVLEEKLSRAIKTRDSTQSELSGVRAQLVAVRARFETAERGVREKREQVEILQQSVAQEEAQRREAEEEVERLRRTLEEERERRRNQGVVRGGKRSAGLDYSLSTASGEEQVDGAVTSPSDSSLPLSSTPSRGDPNRELPSLTSPPLHHLPPSSSPPSSLYRAQIQEMGLKIEKARRLGQEAAEARKAGEISVLKDELGSKSRTITSLQTCLLSLKDDMGKLQHKMQAHSASVQASHYSTKQLENQLADLKKSSSLHPPSPPHS